jgi:predicted choloylglycine hydrolase
MKNIILILSFFLISKTQASLNSNCELKNSIDSQKHYVCKIKNKNVHFLDIKGDMSDVAYYHGKFLSNEMKDGVIKAVMTRKEESFNALEKSERETFETVFKCIKSRYKRSIKKSFIKELERLADGAKMSRKKVLEATLMIEMSSYIDALDVKMSQNKKKAYLELMSQCGLRLASKSFTNIIKKVTKPLKKLKMGCTGFVAGNEFTSGDEFLHGRNFDTGLLGVFDKYPVILRHTPKKGHTYIGMSSAGLHYSGGITGLNSKGISVSTHELRTTKVRTLYTATRPNNNRRPGVRKRIKYGVIAPYMANLIVKEASSIDQAIKLIKSYGHFGAWTFFISDSKTNEAASIEVSGDIVRVAMRRKGSLSQANHFRHADTAKYNFEYSINKSLESRARISHVEESLRNSRGRIDSQWGIDMLSGHIDHYMGVRSFGRTVSKVYTSMSHVIDSSNNELWFSLGESFPANFSTFLGIQIDFDTRDRFFTFLKEKKSHEVLRSELPFFESILKNYTLAYMNNRDNGQSTESLKRTIQLLRSANSIAKDNNYFDFPTQIMHTRLGLKLYGKTKNKSLILNIKNDLELILANQFSKLHTYEQSQVLRDLAIIEDLEGNRAKAKNYFNRALIKVRPLTKEFSSHHFLWVYVAELKVFKKRGFSNYDLSNLHFHFATAE